MKIPPPEEIGEAIEFLRERGQGADSSDLAAVLALVPETQPADYDRFSAPENRVGEPEKNR